MAPASQPLLQTSLLFEHDLLYIPTVKTGGVCTVRRASEEELPLLASVRDVSETKAEQFRQRVRRGDRCYFAYLDGDLVGFFWVQTTGSHHMADSGRTVTLSPGELFFYDGRTAPRARGNRVYPFMFTAILREMADEGFNRALVDVTARNAASLSGIRRVGFRRRRRLYSVRLRGSYRPVQSLPRVGLRYLKRRLLGFL